MTNGHRTIHDTDQRPRKRGRPPQPSSRMNITDKRTRIPAWCYVPMNTMLMLPRAVAYTVPEMARICKVGTTAIYSLIAEGKIPEIRIGRRLVVGRQAFDDFLNGRTQTNS